jgi:hypothetical protein
MRCRRICRELLWLARFGEFGPSSAPHLDHLAQCGNCRDEVGFDRALVQQLRTALAERIANDEPSAGAWSVILERAQTPERGIGAFLHDQLVAMAARLRTATAITAVALAGIIATTTQVSITHPEAGSAETEVVRNSAGEQFERQPLLPRPRGNAPVPVTYVVSAAPSDPELAFLVSASMPSVAPAPATTEQTVEPVPAPAPGASTIESDVVLGPSVSQQTPVDPDGGGRASSAAAAVAPTNEPVAGEPF